MSVKELELSNWMRFRGRHTVRFSQGAHALVAEWHSDPRRSNWGGKTAVLEAIGFALYGRMRFRTEDEWITRGESTGEVKLWIDDVGMSRLRERGESTKVRFYKADKGVAIGDEAENCIAQFVGLTYDEFVESCWLRQKKHAAFVTMTPAERLERVRAWCDLAGIERAHELAKNQFAKSAMTVERMNATIGAHRSALDSARAAVAKAGNRADLGGRLFDVVEQIRSMKAKLDAFLEYDKARMSRTRAESRVEAIRLQLDETKSKMTWADSDEDFEKAYLAAVTADRVASEEIGQAALIAKGEFSGTCPVNLRVCPVAQEIRDDRLAAKARLDAAKRTHGTTSVKLGQLKRDRERRAALKKTLDACERDLKRYEAERDALPPIPPAVEDVDSEVLDSLEAQRESLLRAIGQCEANQSAVERGEAAIKTLEKELEETTPLARLAMQACEVLGRSGVQRTLTSETVAEVQERANAMLATSGIELGVSLEWGKETKRLEPDCPSCGFTHPGTSKVPSCVRCGTPRERARTQGLEVVLSDRSGAAEDLAGLALSLAAGAVLRARRGSRWPLVMVDEPFSALDEAHSEILSRQLGRLLTVGSGFSQSIIVAHSRKIASALPNRIVVHADADGSRIDVEP